jgi:YVTN family beta-propeller protein
LLGGAAVTRGSVAVHPDGSAVYVANLLDDTVSVIATASNAVVHTVAVGSVPIAFGQFFEPLPQAVSSQAARR